MNKSLHLIILVLFVNLIFAQEPNDCINAIPICSNGIFSYSVSIGPGLKQEINNCGGTEHNTLWLKLTVIQSGTLGFDLVPDSSDIKIDYDFWVYGPATNCPSLGNTPIRCSTTNPSAAELSNNYTGMNETSVGVSQGPGANGTGYVKWLTVTAGEVYYLALDDVSYDRGFHIEWTGTATIGCPLSVETQSVNNFLTTVCPNPFSNAFVIDVNTLSQEVFKIKVYDMLGKLIEQREVNPNMISAQRIGQNYSTGIYNVIVTQENEVKMLRVIKE